MRLEGVVHKERLKRLAQDFGDEEAESRLIRASHRAGELEDPPLWMQLGLVDPDLYVSRTGKGRTTQMCLEVAEYVREDRGQDAILVTHTQDYGIQLRRKIWGWLDTLDPWGQGRRWRIVLGSVRPFMMERLMLSRSDREVRVFWDHYAREVAERARRRR
jgi:hypothetical protein